MNSEAFRVIINNYSEIILAISGLVVGLTVWLRKERIANAKTDVEIAAQKAESKKHEGQNTEIDILLRRVTEGENERNKLSKEIAKQGKDIRDLKEEVNQLEMILVGISILFNNLLLCNDCRIKNEGTVDAIKVLLDKIKKRKDESDHDAD